MSWPTQYKIELSGIIRRHHFTFLTCSHRTLPTRNILPPTFHTLMSTMRCDKPSKTRMTRSLVVEHHCSLVAEWSTRSYGGDVLLFEGAIASRSWVMCASFASAILCCFRSGLALSPLLWKVDRKVARALQSVGQSEIHVSFSSADLYYSKHVVAVDSHPCQKCSVNKVCMWVWRPFVSTDKRVRSKMICCPKKHNPNLQRGYFIRWALCLYPKSRLRYSQNTRDSWLYRGRCEQG